MIAFLIHLGTTLFWYFFNRSWGKNRSVNKHIHHYQGVIRKDSLDAYKREFYQKGAEEGTYRKPYDRVYYSTPGRSFMRFIWKGRILNSDETGPYPFNTR